MQSIRWTLSQCPVFWFLFGFYRKLENTQRVQISAGPPSGILSKDMPKLLVRLPNLVKIIISETTAAYCKCKPSARFSVWRFAPWILTLTSQKLIVTFWRRCWLLNTYAHLQCVETSGFGIDTAKPTARSSIAFTFLTMVSLSPSNCVASGFGECWV